jgi:hypothetical protein
MLRRLCSRAAIVVACVGMWAPPARAYSVLAHQSTIDALWDTGIRPALLKRFPRTASGDLAGARAFAYGGSVIQDLGYYPFGSHFFSNLLHYVRSGDFVVAMLRDARDVNEYAFALGTLAHYAADNTGHPEAVNRAVALMFPKLRAKYGDAIPYAKSPATHVLVEFSFDVVQAAAAAYPANVYHEHIGFEVSKPLLERAFRDTYSIDLKDVFLFDVDLAIGSYRHAIGEWIPELTRAAWKDKKEEIERLVPGISEDRFLFAMSRDDYEKRYGVDYKRPGFFARFLAFLYGLLPKIGPLRPLQFETPTPASERLFVESLRDTRQRFRTSLSEVVDGRLTLANTDFDTGRPSAHGEYELADKTYSELLDRLSKRKFRDVSTAVRRNILGFYEHADRATSRKERRQLAELRGGEGRHDDAVLHPDDAR